MSKKKKIVLIVAVLLLIGAGVGFYFYRKTKQISSDSSSTTGKTFDEAYYLAQNPDVAAAVTSGQLSSGYQHYLTMVASGQEQRQFRFI